MIEMTERTGCVVVGGGPAGMVAGLLLARAGVEVTVLEKDSDFLRDFRGDTVHPSTLTLLDELGLGEKFAKIPHRLVERIQIQIGNDLVPVGDFRRIPGPHKHLAFVPQWDFLDLLADAGRAEPTFTLRMNTQATGLLTEGGALVTRGGGGVAPPFLGGADRRGVVPAPPPRQRSTRRSGPLRIRSGHGP